MAVTFGGIDAVKGAWVSSEPLLSDLCPLTSDLCPLPSAL
jgi:hypothetical protein